MILNFRQLEILRAIMTAKTISGAAELLHVSQPGISRTLKYMEMKLGVDLFERRQNGLIPTPEAKELFAEVQPLYKRLDELDSSIGRIIRADNAYIQIGCAPSLSHFVLPTLLAGAKKQFPNLTARIDTMSNEELAEYIVSRHGDFALSTYDPNHPLVLAEKTIMGRIQCIVPKEHELADKSLVTMAEIGEHNLVTYYSDTGIGRQINGKFAELEIEPKVSIEVRFNPDACAMVEHGLGVGFIFQYATDANLYPNLRFLEIEDDMGSIPSMCSGTRAIHFPIMCARSMTSLWSSWAV